MEFWWLWRADTHCAVFFPDEAFLKQGCKVSQSQHYSAEVSLPKNWVNEKPESLIELNTFSYGTVLPYLPPTIYSAFIFLFSTPQPCVLLRLSWQLCELWRRKRSMSKVCFILGSSALNVRVSRGSSEPATEMGLLGEGDLQLTSLIMWLKQLVSTSAMRTLTGKLSWAIYISEFSVNLSLSIITPLCCVCLRQTF